VLVEFEYQYTGRDGGLVSIKPNERYVLLAKTNDHWWHVRKDEHTKPFYIPAKYVKELPQRSITQKPCNTWIRDSEPAGFKEVNTLVHVSRCCLQDNKVIFLKISNGRLRSPPSCGDSGIELYTVLEKARENVTEGKIHSLSVASICILLRRNIHGIVKSLKAVLCHFKDLILIEFCSFLMAEENLYWGQSLAVRHSATVLLGSLKDNSLCINNKSSQSENPNTAVYVNVSELRKSASLSSPTDPAPGRHLSSESPEWEVHTDAESGQEFYYNPATGQTTWDSPFLDRDAPLEEQPSPPLSPSASPSPTPPASGGQGSEWQKLLDDDSSGPCRQLQWIRSVDDLGQTYFYTTDGTKSQWNLPEEVELGTLRLDNFTPPSCNTNLSIAKLYTLICIIKFCKSGDRISKFFPSHRRNVSDYGSDVSSSGNSPELLHHTLEKAGILNKTKVADNGKKLRKNWAQSWTVLHGGILTFNKDPKSQQSGTASKTNQIVPEYTVELRGATISWAGKDKSSKKNVLELKTRHGSEYLIQYDTESIIQDWHKVIMDTIRQLDHGHHSEEEDGDFGGSEKSPGPTDRDEKDKKRAATKPAAPSSAGDAEQKKVRTKLKKFLQKRPTLQSVKERGYIRDQVFGCRLDALCERENVTIPTFVEKCIQAVEKRGGEKGLEIDGIYRVSGNLAVIQKLRIKVDQEESLNLEDGQWEDIHVITGALKLFFRELPEPLFPFSHFNNFIAAINIGDNSQKVTYMRDLVRSLPQPNQDTMQELFRHLRRVIERREDNRMSVQSIAIVFGPTLLRPETESANITMYMVFQNQIVEYILNEYDRIFYPS
uniref:Rho GTPase activating protein 27 n=1 Tax=Lepisosteus oculatus TaxID=7918 RepID=W5N6C8_LEPOC